MAIYKETKDYKLIHDNMLNMGDYIADGTIDCVITDPPYELGFMGKKWDGSGIAFNVDAWTKCFNALKDGGYLLAFGGTRTFHRIACAIEDAGFEIRDTIMYLYGSGFPKSLNIGLAVDKLNGVESKIVGSQTKGSSPLPNNHNGTWSDNQKDGTFDIKQAQNEWQGWGTALKPAYEPIIVARKPMKTSVAENVFKNGVGGINIDECRVGTEVRTQFSGKGTNGNVYFEFKQDNAHFETVSGRFPANIIHDGSDEVVSGFPETSSGLMTPEHTRHTDGSPNGIYGKFDVNHPLAETYGDSGNASRFFYTAKASKKDRDEGLDAFEATEGHAKGNGLDRVCEFCGTPQLKAELCKCPVKSWIAKPKKNTHPTVKPIELMQYLVRLVAPKGATILDCFMGSGSTGKAVMFENRERNANYKFIGIELTDEYLPICEARIEYAINKYEYDEKIEQAKTGQVSLFDFNFEEKTDV